MGSNAPLSCPDARLTTISIPLPPKVRFMLQTLSRLFSCGRRSTPDSRRPRRSPLGVECLEDRLVPATLNVTTFADVVDANDGQLSLREAISRANATVAPDIIVLRPGVHRIGLTGPNENANSTGDFDVTNPLTIVGQGASKTAIDAGRLDRLFEVFGTIGVTFSQLTLRNGGGLLNGGAIQAEMADLRLQGCAVSGNFALNGGGINAVNGDVVLLGCVINRNTTQDDGGGVNVGAGMLTVRNSQVRNNVARDNGGGLRAATARLFDSTISGNAAQDGGGLHADTATLNGCTFSGNNAGDSGGGLSVENQATLTNCIVNGNTALGGGGGGLLTETATVMGSTFSGNVAAVEGGGIQADTVTLTDSTIRGNTGGLGGGLYASGTTIVTNSTVVGNSADFAGGVYAGPLTVKDSTISGNLADTAGGIFSNFSATLTNSTVSGNFARETAGGIFASRAILTGCTVSGNSAGVLDEDYADEEVGGGIFAGEATLTNCTISGNSAGNRGGGLFVNLATLVNVTLTDNSAHDGGGVFHEGNAALNVKNTIIAQNYVDFGGSNQDVRGSFVSQGFNLIGDGTGSTGFGGSNDQVGTSSNPIDPRLAPLAFNGGRTRTHALLPGSRAIDRGNNTDAPTTDQRGVSRPRDGDGDGSSLIDIGAFER